MVSQNTFVITHRTGLHLRPSKRLSDVASRFKSDITLEYKGRKVNAKSLMEIMMLGCMPGNPLTVRCNGDDATAALNAIEDLINNSINANEDGV